MPTPDPAQTIDIGTVATVQLNGSASTQAQGHTDHVRLVADRRYGRDACRAHTPRSPTFTAPVNPTTLTFSLTVVDTQSPITGTGTNGNTSTPSTVNVVLKFQSPTVDAGPDQVVHVGDLVQLQGSAAQFNGHTLLYTWNQTAGTTRDLV